MHIFSKFLTWSSLVVLSFTAFTPVALLEGDPKPEYNPVVVIDDLQFSAVLTDKGIVEMNWKPFTPEGFTYYKVVRSTKNPKPVYPEDGQIQFSDNPLFTSHTDKAVPEGEVHYRLCVIAKPDRYCSKVITIRKEHKVNTEADAELTLSGQLEGNEVVLSWQVRGELRDGFKVVKSYANDLPMYPPLDGDKAIYIPDSKQRSYTDTEIKSGKTYYYRVCDYNKGGFCKNYSNNIAVRVGEGVVTIGSVSDVSSEPLSFRDIRNHRYENAIEYVRKKKIVEGYQVGDERTYKPEQEINRAEFTKIIIEAMYPGQATGGYCFPDVNNEWYAKYVCMAKAQNIIAGYPDGRFRPDENVNFVEAAKIMVLVFELEHQEAEGPWYQAYLDALSKHNFIPQTINTTGKRLNRGEMAELIWRIRENVSDQESAALSVDAPTETPGDWQVFSGDGYQFQYPNSWYRGEKRGWQYLSEEKDYIDNLHTPGYLDVDMYLVTYRLRNNIAASATDLQALSISNYFDHPELRSEQFTVNDMPVLKRTFRAARGSRVNGRTTVVPEVITQFTYRDGQDVIVLQYFDASGKEDYRLDLIEQIFRSLQRN